MPRNMGPSRIRLQFRDDLIQFEAVELLYGIKRVDQLREF